MFDEEEWDVYTTLKYLPISYTWSLGEDKEQLQRHHLN